LGNDAPKWSVRIDCEVTENVHKQFYNYLFQRFYEDFPSEWRQNETVNLLLGMILLFNVEVAGLQSAISVTVENMKFQSLLRR
jgi:hypothetical protein